MMCIHWSQLIQAHLSKTHVNPGHTQYAIAYHLPTNLTSAFATCILVKLCAYVSLANPQYQFPGLCTLQKKFCFQTYNCKKLSFPEAHGQIPVPL